MDTVTMAKLHFSQVEYLKRSVYTVQYLFIIRRKKKALAEIRPEGATRQGGQSCVRCRWSSLCVGEGWWQWCHLL